LAVEDHNGNRSTRVNPRLEEHYLVCQVHGGLATTTVSRRKRVTLLIPHPERAPPSASFAPKIVALHEASKEVVPCRDTQALGHR
jgi:hypothetical protein